MKWGWSEETKEPVVPRSELKEIKFDTIIPYGNGISTTVSFLFPCLECIRRHYGKERKIYVVHDNKHGFAKSYISIIYYYFLE